MYSYDRIADQFHSLRTTLQPVEQKYLATLAGDLLPGSRILDLGCGTGRPIAVHLVTLGYHVTGVDASASMLAYAIAALPDHRWIHARLEKFETSETFDAVLCWDSLFHLPRHHFAPTFHKCHRWLRPGGKLLVSSGGLVEEDSTGFTDTMFGHEFYYDSLSPRQMQDDLLAAGFEILISEMCDQPDGGRNRGKWATLSRRACQ